MSNALLRKLTKEKPASSELFDGTTINVWSIVSHRYLYASLCLLGL
jgi:hypothetical protein